MRDGTTRISIRCAVAASGGRRRLGLAGRRPPAAPCGTRAGAAPATYRHVIVIMEENTQHHRRPRRRRLGRRPAGAVPEPPGGGVRRRDELPRRHPPQPSQLHGGHRRRRDGGEQRQRPEHLPARCASAGGTWRVYQGSMQQRCQRSAAFPYKPQHNPGVAYTSLASDCKRWDTNLNGLSHDIATGGLPAYAFIAPDQCKDMEIGCGGTNAITVGDNWLQTWIPRLLATRGYRTGHTAIFITWDEGTHGSGVDRRELPGGREPERRQLPRRHARALAVCEPRAAQLRALQPLLAAADDRAAARAAAVHRPRRRREHDAACARPSASERLPGQPSTRSVRSMPFGPMSTR